MNTLKIGLTGGIGSGKSTVARIFSTLGIPVYTADTEAKKLMQENKEVKKKIMALFGEIAYTENGQLNRGWLSEKVFQNKAILEKLNAIVHPAVWKDAEHWFHKQSAPYAVEEAAILIESGSYKKMDKIIVVQAPEELRIKRVMDRDGSSYEEVKNRMDNQLSPDERLKHADYRIDNDGERRLIPQVLDIDRQIRRMT